MSLKKQLERYKKHLKQSDQLEKEKEPRTATTDSQLEKSMKEAAKNLKASILTYEEEAIMVKEEAFPLNESYGLYPLEAINEAVGLWQQTFTQHPLSATGLAPTDLLFFDTETTGLASGAGHMIFLLGCGWVKDNDFIVKQYFLPGPGHETAFYYHFLTDVTDLTNLVTFNGKSFDWPRVKTRVQFVRDRVPKLPAFGHYDLLHASRRLWKDEWENVRLQTIEEKVLGLQRDGDVPGHMAPFLYFEFLKAPKASLIEGIFRHNADDIKTLMALYSHLTFLIHGRGEKRTPKESYEIGRWFASLGMTREAIMTLSEFETTSLDKEYVKAYMLLAECYKKLGNIDHAVKYYQLLVDTLKIPNIDCCIELAKIFEHQKQDYEKALYYVFEAQNIIAKKTMIGKQKYEKLNEDVNHRMERLHQKQLRNK